MARSIAALVASAASRKDTVSCHSEAGPKSIAAPVAQAKAKAKAKAFEVRPVQAKNFTHSAACQDQQQDRRCTGLLGPIAAACVVSFQACEHFCQYSHMKSSMRAELRMRWRDVAGS